VKALNVALLSALVLLAAGCGRKVAGQEGGTATGLHQNVPPHGGTAVGLGDDYCVEFVREPGTGLLSAYVLDDEMEDFIRIAAPSFTVVAHVQGEDRPLVLGAVANAATGETVGATSLFQVQADWLKSAGAFDATLQAIQVKGSDFSHVRVSLPAAHD
jgi:hypothetical protein